MGLWKVVLKFYFDLYSQCFDFLVDQEGDFLMGGHTTAGEGVVNWDYLALKVDGETKEVLWRNTYGQPRGFNPK